MIQKALIFISISLLSLSSQAGKTLIIGDSHSACYRGFSTNYVNQLRKCIKGSGSDFLSIARNSAAPGHYTGAWSFKNYCRMDNSGITKTINGSPKLSQQLRDYKPDHVVVTLGDNTLSHSHKSIVAQYKKLIDQIKSSENTMCTLVTPTHPTAGNKYSKTQIQLQKVIDATKEAAAGECKIIDSTKLLPEGMGGDGVHLTPSGYNKWGKAVCDQLNQKDTRLLQPIENNQEVQIQEANLEGFFSNPEGSSL